MPVMRAPDIRGGWKNGNLLHAMVKILVILLPEIT